VVKSRRAGRPTAGLGATDSRHILLQLQAFGTKKGREVIGRGSRSTQQYYPGTIETLQTTLIF
jgi:hypothetical protein